jgi:phosphatidylglycerophosphate synthase
MRMADVLTGFRIVVAPIVIWLILCDERSTAYYLFAAAAITDTLDGYFARKSKKVVSYGDTFDAIADCVLVFSTIFTLGIKGEALFLIIIMLSGIVFWTPVIAIISKKAGGFQWPHLDTNLFAAAVYPTVMAHIIRWQYAEVLDLFTFVVVLHYMWKYIVFVRSIYR